MSRVVVAFVLGATVVLSAQERQSDRAFESEVNYVRVDLYTTADGQPVTDLEQLDIEILEDDKPVEIAPRTLTAFRVVP